MMTRAVAGRMLTRGGHDLAQDEPDLAQALARAAPWEFASGVLVLEGTGATSPWILPAAETFAQDGGKRLATQRVLQKRLRADAPVLMDAFKVEGLPFYGDKQEAQRRVSPFYRGVAFLMSSELKNPVLGTLAVVDVTTHTRGAEIGALLRQCGQADGPFALVSPFKAIGRAQWDAEITPLAACVQNQMALSRIGRFSPIASAAKPPLAMRPASLSEALGRLGHDLPDAVVQGLAKPLPLSMSLGDALDRHARGATRTPVPRATPTGPENTVVLYSQPWRLKDEAVNRQVHAELKALEASGAVRGHRFVHHRPLAQCTDTLELHLILPAE
jgi:hypothetical protein